ncbi:MAG TPA: hypothetical protein VFG83_13565, partial [Kofleriaceae bacterium]|nr:hypothetical protein [Kofleriaceae bacterium]
KHFVKYRDDRSPYGYDATSATAVPEGFDLVAHDEEVSQSYARDQEISLANLLLRLSLGRVPASSPQATGEGRQHLLIAARRGLAGGVIRYLWRNRVTAEVGLARPTSRSAFQDSDHELCIARVRDLPERMRELFLATPGIDVFAPVAANVAVEVGYRHVIDLSACTSVVPEDRTFLFRGDRGAGEPVLTLKGPLELSAIEHVTDIDLGITVDAVAAGAPQPGTLPLAVSAPDPLGVRARLEPSSAAPRNIKATLIPLERAEWLKKLVFFLPEHSVRGHRIAVTDRGIVVVGDAGIDLIPIGEHLTEHAPGLLIPIGMEIAPRVMPEVLAHALGHDAGLVTIMPRDGSPFQLKDTALLPLERSVLARVTVKETQSVSFESEPTAAPSVVNDPVGRFALWGFPSGPKRKALPPAPESEPAPES